MEDFMNSFVLFDRYDEIEGFGPEMDKAITNFDYSEANEIVKYLTFEKNNDIIISESESNLKDRTPEEIFTQDYKKFSVNDINFGVGQISSMDKEELYDIKEKIMPYMKEQLEIQGVNMIFFMLTSMIETSTMLIAMGNDAGSVIENAFDTQKIEDGIYNLEGVVSRKKQLIPEILAVLTQE